MGWKQVRNFNLSKMGKKKGYCLQNVRLAYDIPSKYVNAKEAMEASKRQGTFHEGLNIPTDVAIPIFAETGSPDGHVMVDDHGTVYSDGEWLPSFKGMRLLGWSETLNDVRIVEWVEQPAPQPAPQPVPPAPKPEPTPEPAFKVGDQVVPTKLVDYNGTPLVQYDPCYTITQLSGDRAVLSARGAVWAAMNTANIRKV